MTLSLKDLISVDYWRNFAEAAAGKAFLIVLVVVGFIIVRWIAFRIVNKTLKTLTTSEGITAANTAGRLNTIGTLVKSVIFYILFFISLYMIIRIFGADMAPILTAAGVLGLAIGFGSQKLVRDIISGCFILLENQYSVGDYITIGAVTGTVEGLGMRVTRVRDDVGKLVMISNGDIGQVTNHSRGPIRATIEIGVSADADLKKVYAAINRAGEQVAARVKGVVTPPAADGLTGIASTKLTIRISGKIKPRRQEAVNTALRECLREEFAKDEIKLV